MNFFFFLKRKKKAQQPRQCSTQRTAKRNISYSKQAGLRRKNRTYIELNGCASWSSSETSWAEQRARCTPKRIGSCVCGSKEAATAGACSEVFKKIKTRSVQGQTSILKLKVKYSIQTRKHFGNGRNC